MDIDPLSTFQTPPSERRRVVAVLATPPRSSDLLAAFGARKSLSSASRMARQSSSHHLRAVKKPSTYAELSDSDTSPQRSPGDSDFGAIDSSKTSIELSASDESDDDADELQDDDVIQVAQQRRSTRELPRRSTRSRVSYATPKKPVPKNKKKSQQKGRKANPVKLTSDILPPIAAEAIVSYETERQKIRNNITQGSKRRRDAFLLSNAEYFLPVLPESNYINKLKRTRDHDGAGEDIIPYESLETKPQGITATMKPYQLSGLSFLVFMYRNGVSAILGDEMGLGKTLQTLSLFQYLKANEPIRGENRPCIVVCPLSVLSSWMNESKKWAPDLAVVRFHGPKSEREKLKADCRATGKAVAIDVIVTTYETFVAEQNWFKRAFVWRYCVLDEGHKIKNSQSDVSQALHGLKAEHRLLLTGTPLQNNLHEMWALLHWLYDEVFTIDTADSFKGAFDLSKGKVSTSFMDDARRLLELVMLRRMKTSPGVNLGLPPKEEVLLYVPLTPMQRFWYTRLLTKADNGLLDELFKDAKAKEQSSRLAEIDEDEQFGLLEDSVVSANSPSSDAWAESKDILERAIQSEEVGSKGQWQKLMNLILQLRKVCSHPYILPHAAPDPYYLGDHIKNASGKFIVLDKLVQELVIKQGKKVIIFAGLTKTLDLCQDVLDLQGAANPVEGASFRYARLDGSTARARRNLGIRMFNTDDEHKVMLISTRAGGLGINLTSATNVVFMDEDWNPQVTLQAEARAHRIGQTQKVTVFRLCSQGTVEEQMLGRIRKKLYLSTKITESMRNIHSGTASGKKRKRPSHEAEEDAPQLDTTSLKSLIRRGAHTLARSAIDVTEMLEWDWETTLAKCQDKPADEDPTDEADEGSWLNSMEKVECAVFEGKKHQKKLDKAAKDIELNRADRRIGKNTTVMIGGFAINKESLNCADWEAVPTLAGKDPRLQEPARAKKAPINHQDFCQHCWDGGALVVCSGCPRTYHTKCLDKPFQQKVKGMSFYCPQHECVDCQAKTTDAGGLIYRCRWCENGYCEDCLDWESTKLIGDTLMEYEMLGFESMQNAYYVECPACINDWKENAEQAANVDEARREIQAKYLDFQDGLSKEDGPSWTGQTPATVSEVGTPMAVDMGMMSQSKKLKMS